MLKSGLKVNHELDFRPSFIQLNGNFGVNRNNYRGPLDRWAI